MSKLLRMALESQAAQESFWDMLAHASDSIVDIDKSKCSEKIMAQLRLHPDLIKAVDDWILSPDRSLLPKLRQMGEVVKEVYKGKGLYRGPFTAYRGFDSSATGQDMMGLTEKRLFFNRLKQFDVGDVFEYKSASYLLSFTPLKSIARAFGDIVVEITVDPVQDDFLYITDELCVLVCERRNIKPESQKELIMFPPFHLSFKINEKPGSKK